MNEWLANNWAIITTAVTLVFYIGVSYTQLKQKASRGEVYKIAREEIGKHKKECTYYPETDGKVLNQCVSDLKKDFERVEKKLDTVIENLIK